MKFETLLSNVLSLSNARGVMATVNPDNIVVSEGDEFFADLRFSLSDDGEILVVPIEDDGSPLADWEGAGTFSTVETAFEHYDIG